MAGHLGEIIEKELAVVATWSKILEARAILLDAPEPDNAERYSELVRESEKAPPYHLIPILRYLAEVESATGKSRDGIVVLDHGCGGGATLMYLAAMGYRQVYGVDVDGDIYEADLALRAITELTEPQLLIYDGLNLPFPADMFDFIFSQQVVEHVDDNCIGVFLDEEVRVLSGSGIVYHQIPHRWTPWESHTKTWVIHYLPRQVRIRLYILFGHDPEYVEKLLFLRTPLYYTQQFRARYPTISNKTLERLTLRPDAAYYDGNLKLRQLVSASARLPVIRSILSNLVMLDLTARKKSQNGSTDHTKLKGLQGD
tara:strand:- start:89623 stop:90561 length:939 start_codon:yes stop_codon:yes gene_type:complete